jgi:hypothetical protein
MATNGYDPALPDQVRAHESATWLELELQLLIGQVALARIELEAAGVATGDDPAYQPLTPARANLPLLV